MHVQGSVILIRQQDQPGIVAGVASVLADEKINISFMSVGRTGPGKVRAPGCSYNLRPPVPFLEASCRWFLQPLTHRHWGAY
jgi:D-3-phosphoglycerate dehydrogenase